MNCAAKGRQMSHSVWQHSVWQHVVDSEGSARAGKPELRKQQHRTRRLPSAAHPVITAR